MVQHLVCACTLRQACSQNFQKGGSLDPAAVGALGDQGGVTPIDATVTAVTAMVNLYTKEGVELLRILLYTSINVCVINGQWLKFNAVVVKAPKISMVNGQNAKKSWSKF